MFVAVDESDHESDDADGEMQLMPTDSESVLERAQDGVSDATSAVVRVPASSEGTSIQRGDTETDQSSVIERAGAG